MKKLFWKIPVWFFSITFALVVLLRFLPIYVTPLMVIRVVEAMFDEDRDVRVEKTWVPIEKMSSKIPRAAIAGEDDMFLTHYGFSVKGIQQAYKDNKKGKRLKGGSTISQQTAKNVFTTGSRTWVRKGFETYFTLLIELVWGKERIMEVYLNVVELGDGIYGDIKDKPETEQQLFKLQDLYFNRRNSYNKAVEQWKLDKGTIKPDRKDYNTNRDRAWILW
jgi:monofunctional biosynthetic peptidoglycan transglycosylase